MKKIQHVKNFAYLVNFHFIKFIITITNTISFLKIAILTALIRIIVKSFRPFNKYIPEIGIVVKNNSKYYGTYSPITCQQCVSIL